MAGLCWEGGGSKGAFGVKFLYELKKDYPDLSFSSLAGTSVGGINIVPLIIDDFELLMNFWLVVKEDKKFIYKRIFSTKYNIDKFLNFVDDLTKNKDFFKKIKDSQKTYLIFSKIENGEILIFTNKKLKFNDAKIEIIKTEEDLKYAILGTSAIPKIFPEVNYNGKILIDGGIEHTFPIKYLIEATDDKKFLGILHEPLNRKYKPNPLKFIFSPFSYLVEKITFDITKKDLDGLIKIDKNIFEYKDRKIFLIYPENPLPSAMNFSKKAIEDCFNEGEKVYKNLKQDLINFLKV
ncbi:MAG: patatin-like phospholipase family protein [Caldisericia bacterium]